MATDPPLAVVFDLRSIIDRYYPFAPYGRSHHYNDLILARFVEQFTIQRIIESNFILHYDEQPGTLLWEYVEATFPDGLGEFGDSADSMCAFQVLSDEITLTVEDYMRERFANYWLPYSYTELVFNCWMSTTAAHFMHREARL